MKRILVLLSIIYLYSTCVGAQDICKEGDQNQPNQEEPDRTPLDSIDVWGGQLLSGDPNELLGPSGIDSVRWVSANSLLNYYIFFENDPEIATANAQMIDVRFGMPYASLFKDFGLGNYYFANQSFSIPDYPSAFSTRLDLRDSMYIYVDLLAGIDVTLNQAFWHFTSIDPETGYAPWQAYRGLLPVNDSTHVGEGFVSFRLQPKELQTGDTISLVAKIVFDQNDTIATNRWCNRIDAGAPTSKVKGKKDNTNNLLYHLSFEANDDRNGCGVKNVRLFQADKFGNYEEIGAYTHRFTPDHIRNLEPGQIFVFGSNAAGMHGGGAARTAVEKFGAVMGQGEGLQGQSYAIPTMEGLEETRNAVQRFIQFADSHREMKFLVTRIGCGIAGYTPRQIAPMFVDAIYLNNIYLPEDFWREII